MCCTYVLIIGMCGRKKMFYGTFKCISQQSIVEDNFLLINFIFTNYYLKPLQGKASFPVSQKKSTHALQLWHHHCLDVTWYLSRRCTSHKLALTSLALSSSHLSPPALSSPYRPSSLLLQSSYLLSSLSGLTLYPSLHLPPILYPFLLPAPLLPSLSFLLSSSPPPLLYPSTSSYSIQNNY